jgi:lipid A 4'-phosphatase
MSYWRLPRTRGILALFMISSVSLVLIPGVDLQVSSFFSGGAGFQLATSWWVTALHASVGFFVCTALATVVGIFWFNRITKRDVGGVDARVVGYVFLVLALGAGLIVNATLKNGFGRARPRNIIQFGGDQQFTPAFVLSKACATNCSFSSGDSSGAFFSFALALALSRRRAPMVAAAVYGGLVSFSRIAAGAHFLSDTVVSFFVMWITAEALYHFMLVPGRATGRSALPATPQPPGPPARGERDVGMTPSYVGANAVEVSRGAR